MLQEIKVADNHADYLIEALQDWVAAVTSYPTLPLAVPKGADLEYIQVGGKFYRPARDIFWDAAAMLFVLADGKEIKREDVLLAFEMFILYLLGIIEGISWRLLMAKITLKAWHDAMLDAIRKVHYMAAVIASGGFASVRDADISVARAVLEEQERLLAAFERQIADGTQPLDGRLTRRAGMYIHYGRITLENVYRKQAAERGFTMERRVLGPAEHCQDCLVYAAAGWQPIGTLPPIGESRCRTNCHCHFEYR